MANAMSDDRRQRDWWEWHAPYDDPGSPLSRRLEIVQDMIRSAINAAPPGPIRVISVCAGHGRDLIGVGAGHPRAADLVARLVELNPRNANAARSAATQAGLQGIEVVEADAALTDAYAGAVPAHLVLACGVFGNISDADIERTVHLLPSLCEEHAAIIWTRHRGEPDLTPAIRAWFAEAGFEEEAFEAPPGFIFGVGHHRLTRPPDPFRPGRRMFAFIDTSP